MTEDEKYLFDLTGYLVIENVLTPEEVAIFTEAVTHGTLPWRARHERRSLLFRFSPGNLAYGKNSDWGSQVPLEELTEEQRAVLEPPNHPRLQRPVLDDQGKKVS